MTVSLTNTSKRPFVASLYHAIFCEGGAPCKCVDRTFRHPEAAIARGRRIIREARVVTEVTKEPVTLSIEPGKTVHGLPNAVMKVPQVKAATRGVKPTLRLMIVPDDTGAKKATSSPKDSKPSGGQGKETGDGTSAAPKEPKPKGRGRGNR